MSCIKCEEFQDSDKTSYFRWKNANIEIRGCEEHLREIFEMMRENRRKEENDAEK